MKKQELVNEIKEINEAIKKVKGWLWDIAWATQNKEGQKEAIRIGCNEVSNVIAWESKQKSFTKQQLTDVRDKGLSYLAEINAKMDRNLAAM